MVCSRCNAGRIFLRGAWYPCKCSYRFKQMRWGAMNANKIVPEILELETMFVELVKEMKCPHCKTLMRWTGRTSTTITLQHYPDGKLGFLCFGCNARHSSDPSFMQIPLGSKRCYNCGEVKLLSEFGNYFSTTKNYYGNKTCVCKECSRQIANRKNLLKRSCDGN